MKLFTTLAIAVSVCLISLSATANAQNGCAQSRCTMAEIASIIRETSAGKIILIGSTGVEDAQGTYYSYLDSSSRIVSVANLLCDLRANFSATIYSFYCIAK